MTRFQPGTYDDCGCEPLDKARADVRALTAERDNLLEELDGAVKLRVDADAYSTRMEQERDAAIEQMEGMRAALEEARSWIRSAKGYYQLDLPEDDNCLNVLWRINRALSAPPSGEPARLRAIEAAAKALTVHVRAYFKEHMAGEDACDPYRFVMAQSLVKTEAALAKQLERVLPDTGY